MIDYANMLRQLMMGAQPIADDPMTRKINKGLPTLGGGGGGVVYRNIPSGTKLSYEVLQRHKDGTLTVRGIPPDGYPSPKPFRAEESAFHPTQQAKPFKK
jgi:hypothetical protein